METLQLETPLEVARDEAPKLLVEWTPRWHDFRTSLGPAFSRSERRLAGEAPFGLIPLRIMVPSYVLEALAIFAAIIVPIKINQLRPYAAPTLSSHDVIYYSGDELPRTEDLAGAQAGKTGRAGGDEAHHRTQTIKIARGGSLVPRVVDAPNLKLPASRDAVANLLAIKPNAGPPPSEGMRSTRSAPNLSASIVAPAPNAIRDYTRNGVQLDRVIAPAPTTPRDVTHAPTLSATVIPPAPSVAGDHVLVAPALTPAVVPPAPSAVRDHLLTAPSFNPSVVAPAPTLSRDNVSRANNAPQIAANVIPPAPKAVSREVSSSPLQMTSPAVVPPPVSAPERASLRDPKLAMPSPSVIAPPPSQDISQNMRRLATGSTPDTSRSVVPPPPTQSGSGSFLSGLVGKIFGPAEVVPPPPNVTANSQNNNPEHALAANVVPPPPAVAAGSASGDTHGVRKGSAPSLGTNIVAPPPSTGVSGGTGNRSPYSATAPNLGAPNVVPPPPSLAAAGGGTGNVAGGKGAPSGTLLATNVVPPPPSIGGGASAGSGTGRNGTGLGAPLTVGAPPAPATNGGSGSGPGAVISSQPGSKVGLPGASSGALALSPTGGDKPGVGGAGGGTSIGRGTGPGSGVNGESSGAGKTGSERGSDPNAHAGISLTPGPGGAGNANAGNPPVPGVSVSGGTTEVTLPSFGSDPNANVPSTPGRSPTLKHGDKLGVTIVATASSGGAFEPYKNLLRGEQYTTYLDTSAGSVVMAFGEEAPTGNAAGSLTSPQPVRVDLPAGLPHARLMIKCTLDASGNVKNVHVLEPGPADMTAKVVAALHSWKFQPAMRGTQPVEVTAILGFNIDTNDRF